MARKFDPYKLSSPRVYLLAMLIFTALVGFLVFILQRQVMSAFATNPGLNGLIVGVLLVGILLAFLQVIRIMPEVRWVNSFRAGNLDNAKRDPVLLAPMQAMLKGQSDVALSTASTQSILESIGNRLDERRDISRYLISLLVFLGLLGTFWGLLATIGSIGDTIGSLDPASGDTSDVLDSLKSGLQAPLDGMGTAFSSSLFGLAGSLVLGFLDLQSGQAQNRFYSDLETWLARRTRIAGAAGADADDAPGLSYVAALLEQTAESIQTFERTARQNAEISNAIRRAIERLAAKSEADETPALLRALDERLSRSSEETTAAQARAADDVAKEIKLLARTLSAGASGGQT